MGRRFRITEEQYNQLLDEGIDIQANLDAAGGDVKKAYDTAKREAQQSGARPEDVNIKMPMEGRIITKKEIRENNMKRLKADSKVYTLKDFIHSVKN